LRWHRYSVCTASRFPIAAACVVLAFALSPATVRADDAAARAYFVPARTMALLSLSAGAGAFDAGSAPSQGSGDAKSPPHGYGGARGTLAARADLEAFSPLWLSVVGRTFGVKPAEAELDVSAGYELRWYWVDGRRTSHARVLVRPLVGIRAVRFADSVDTPTTARTTALRAGVDWMLHGNDDIRGFNAWRAHVVGLWDPARSRPGVEVETTAGITLPRALDGAFVGLDLGALPGAGALFVLEIGATWEVGAAR
jgi:hypothetical protein